MTKFEVSHSYSFDVYPSNVLGTGFRNCTVLAIMDHDTAAAQVDTVALHTQVYPYLPTGTPDDPTVYTYIKVKLPNGDITILGMPWINLETIQEVTRTTITATIRDVSANDLDKIRRILEANGYDNLRLDIVR